MKNPSEAGWCSRTTGWAAAVVALAASLAVTPSIARAVCDADCNGNGTVTVNEVVVLTDVILGTAESSACPSGIPSGTATVATAVSGVNNALNGCPAAAVCGDGITQSGEECDPGSMCIGNDMAGTACATDTDCCPGGDCTNVGGVCDTFGQKGPQGTIPRKVCTDDSECGGAKCIRCKSFGGNGCAVNCTTEMVSRIKLVPGQLQSGDIKPGTSGAFVHGDPFMVPLTLNGINTLLTGSEPSANGVIPITQRPSGVDLARIPISTLSCACVRGTVYMTCGGTQYEQDGFTPSTDCTSDASVCAGKKPCVAVSGPGNSGEGAIGCTGLASASYEIQQDAGGEMCPVELTMCPNAGPAFYTPGAAGPAGSQILAAASQIGTTTTASPLCSGNDPSTYGPDGQFCTDDDPLTPDTIRGLPSIVTLVSGTATVELDNVNGIPDDNLGPYDISGNVVSCEDIAAGNSTGAAQAGAFTAAGETRNATLGDTANVNVFVSQCTLPEDPTVLGCCADPVAGCCGNGRVDAGEACDDGNTDACGPCNADCSGPGTGTCSPGTACNANAVCQSGLCLGTICG
jgi:hypothetical protein